MSKGCADFAKGDNLCRDSFIGPIGAAPAASICCIGLLFCASGLLTAQTGAKDGEWRSYGGDLGNTRYAPLNQINASNFDKLQVAWRFSGANFGPRPEFNLEATPLMAKGVIYSVIGSRRDVVALDAVTGEIKWVHSENEGERGDDAPRRLSGRGLSLLDRWPRGAHHLCDARLPGCAHWMRRTGSRWHRLARQVWSI